MYLTFELLKPCVLIYFVVIKIEKLKGFCHEMSDML